MKGIVFVGLAFANGLFGLLSGLDRIKHRYIIAVTGQKVVQTVPIVSSPDLSGFQSIWTFSCLSV